MNAAILVVEDDAAGRDMVRTFLSSQSYEVVTAASGLEALEMLDRQVPDLILLDAIMPGLDGFATCRTIKARRDCTDVPVIFMTGLADTDHVVEGLSAGGVDYVTKPLVLEVLAARIKVHLGNARKTRSAMNLLDNVGAKLLTCNDAGNIRWSTPDLLQLRGALSPSEIGDLETALREMVGDAHGTARKIELQGMKLMLERLAHTAQGENLFRITRSLEGEETRMLQEAFGLTPREADVLLWTSHGKSNKDMSEILNISARTVNKHLEQIFIKIGVENRASAASAATTILLRG